MKYFRYFFLLVIVGCSSSKVTYDYDAKTDFTKFKTYSFFEDVGEGLNEIDAKRFVASIENYLDSLGLKKVEKPDFYINVVSEKAELPKNNNVGIGVGGGGRNSGISISTGILFGGNKIREKITIDFVESSNNKLFWQGILNAKVREKIKPEDREILVDQIIIKILNKYPPK